MTTIPERPALAGKRALVTGGSRGIGAAIVRRLAADGARVAFTFHRAGRDAENLVHTAGTQQVFALRADSSDPQRLTAAVAEAAERLDGLDILVNNAGVFELGGPESLPLEAFDRMVAVNIRAVFVAVQAAVTRLADGGRIVNIGSVNAERVPGPGFAVYAMTKSALAGLAQGMAHDLGNRRITVNNVLPGPVDTDMNPADGPMAAAQHAIMALKRHGRADEIASLVAYLARDEAAFVTGANLRIDGGYGA
jgi:3-oxoacyl-[acyl-carrier protein] reductase